MLLFLLIIFGICFVGVILYCSRQNNDNSGSFNDTDDYMPSALPPKKRYSESGEIAEPEKLIVTVPTELSPDDDYTVEVNDGSGWKDVKPNKVIMNADGTATVTLEGYGKASITYKTYPNLDDYIDDPEMSDIEDYAVETEVYDIKEKFADLLPLRTRPFQTYKVKGKNSATGRQKTYTIAAYDETYATKKATERGLLEPLEITVCEDPPTAKQKQFMKSLGMTVKPEFTKYDVSCIIDRTYGGEPAPDQWLMNFALVNDIPFSLYATNRDVLYHIRNEYFIDRIHEIAFWLYAVDYSANGISYFDKSKYLSLAEELYSNDEFKRSYERAHTDGNIDYLKPNKRIKVYQLAKEALT